MSTSRGIHKVGHRALSPLVGWMCVCGSLAGAPLEGAAVEDTTTASAPDRSGNTRTASVEVRFLANAGFLLRSGETGVVIDAFLAKPYSTYGEVPDEVLRELILGGAPFQDVRLALVSHRHEDHFQADVAALFLQRRPEAQLVSSPQVIEALRTHLGSLPQNIHAVWPDSGRTVLWDETPGVRVEFLDLPHGSPRHSDVQNLASIVTIAGRRILHLGDATMQSSAYGAYADQLDGVDVALIPYWFFEDEAGQETVERWLAVPLQIAIHLPVRDAETIMQRLKVSHPEVRLLRAPMQFVRY